MPFNTNKTNDAAAFLTGVGAFSSTYLLGGEPVKTAIGIAILAALGVLGYTGYSTT